MEKQLHFRKLFVLSIPLILIGISACKLERINPQCPNILEMQPRAGSANSTIVIKGSSFYSGSPELYKVSIGDKSFQIIDVPDSNTLRVKVPPGIGSGPVSISVVGGPSCSATQNLNFIYHYTATRVSTLNGSLKSPEGLDVDNQGNLVVADKGNYQVKVIELTAGAIVKTYGKGVFLVGCDSDPIKTNDAHFYADDVDVDLNGNIYIAEGEKHIIRWIDPKFPDSVRIYVGRCKQSDSRPDTVHRLLAKITSPQGVFRDDVSNVLYFIDNLGIRKIFNSLIHVVKKEETREAFQGIEISRSKQNLGPIYVSDMGGCGSICSGVIKSVNEQGVVKDTIKKNEFTWPSRFVLDSKGTIFVADLIANRIVAVYPDGALQIIAGTGNMGDNNVEVPGPQANFRGPSGIALVEKEGLVTWLYISDKGNNKVKAIKLE